MMSCGFRSIWRALVSDCGEIGGASSGASYDYDKLVIPLLCVCGPTVYVGAGIMLTDKGASAVWAQYTHAVSRRGRAGSPTSRGCCAL